MDLDFSKKVALIIFIQDLLGKKLHTFSLGSVAHRTNSSGELSTYIYIGGTVGWYLLV